MGILNSVKGFFRRQEECDPSLGENTSEAVSRQIQNLFNYQGEVLDLNSKVVDRLKGLNHINQKKAEESQDLSHNLFEQVKNSLSELRTLQDGFSRFKDLQSELKSFQEQFSQIQEKIIAIEQIVRQSKILSVNASIEAARAGEQGKGFIPVALAVQNLALNSGKSSREIDLIVREGGVKINHIEKEINQAILQYDQMIGTVITSFEGVGLMIEQLSNNSLEIKSTFQSQEDEMVGFSTDLKSNLEKVTGMIAEFVGLFTGCRIMDLEPNEAHAQMDQFQIIDVRRPDEFNDELGHIKNAILVPIQDQFEVKMKSYEREKSYLFVCRSGGRSLRAARVAMSLGFKNVYNLKGGMLEWDKYFKSQKNAA